jgi:hypothetical protein
MPLSTRSILGMVLDVGQGRSEQERKASRATEQLPAQIDGPSPVVHPAVMTDGSVYTAACHVLVAGIRHVLGTPVRTDLPARQKGQLRTEPAPPQGAHSAARLMRKSLWIVSTPKRALGVALPGIPHVSSGYRDLTSRSRSACSSSLCHCSILSKGGAVTSPRPTTTRLTGGSATHVSLLDALIRAETEIPMLMHGRTALRP